MKQNQLRETKRRKKGWLVVNRVLERYDHKMGENRVKKGFNLIIRTCTNAMLRYVI